MFLLLAILLALAWVAGFGVFSRRVGGAASADRARGRELVRAHHPGASGGLTHPGEAALAVRAAGLVGAEIAQEQRHVGAT